MYVVYGFGAFNEVAFVAMLRSGLDTGVLVQWRHLVLVSSLPVSLKARW